MKQNRRMMERRRDFFFSRCRAPERQATGSLYTILYRVSRGCSRETGERPSEANQNDDDDQYFGRRVYIYNTQSGSTTRTRLVPLYSSASSSFLRAIHSALFHQILPLATNPWPSVPIAYVQPGLNAGWLTVSRIARQGREKKKRATI